MEKIGVGVMGCGVISDVYLKNMTRLFPVLDVRAVADVIPEKAAARAGQHKIPRHGAPEDLLSDDSIRIIVNLTTPPHHCSVAKEALGAGKNVYNEKPLGMTREEGRELMDMAAEGGLHGGGAPDTFLGAGIQACRRGMDAGLIGDAVGAAAFCVGPGHEHWHPSPAFYYHAGGGPVFDMAPYYLTALVSLLGPISGVRGHARRTHSRRIISSEPLKGTEISVEVPTHYSSSLEFAGGALASVMFSFDVWGSGLPRLEIYGSKGSLSLPDPNGFDGPARYLKAGETEWRELPLGASFRENCRGLGVADMAYAILRRRKPRADGDMAYHVLEVMEAMGDSGEAGGAHRIESRCGRPAAMPPDASPEGWD